MNSENIKNLLENALKEHHRGNLDVADKIYTDILKIDKENIDANHLHGTILSQKQKYSEAINYFSIAYDNSKPTCELLNNFAIALRNLRAYSECEKMLKEAIKLDKYFSNSYINLSNCYLSQKKYDDAITVLKTSVELDLNVERSRHDLVNILFYYSHVTGEFSQSTITELKKHLRISSKSSDKFIISKCALFYFNIGDLESSIELFKVSEKMYSESLPSVETIKNMRDKHIIKTLIVHEFEQIRHIDSDEDGIRNMKISQDFYDSLQKLTVKVPEEYTHDDFVFISSIHKIKYNKPPKVRENYINKGLNIDKIENEYTSADPEIVVIDNFLSQEFLEELRIFFRCSNIFKYPYPRGYIGAFLGKGMANRALLEFSTELKNSFKKIFLNYHLSQAWAFKYDSKRDGIGIHADDARVNVNFWITDDTANKDPESGGMIVWKKMPNINASFREFNSPDAKEKMETDVKNVDFIKVPYKSNRVVVFNSKLYHVTDEINFKDNYKDRRVNVTFLYK